MDAKQLRSTLNHLGLSQLEAARLLGVQPRTMQRWIAGNPAVGQPAAEALRAWRRLADLGVAWRPDCEAIAIADAAELARRWPAAAELHGILARVAARGGPTQRWRVSLGRRRAASDSLIVTFNALADGGFAPASYRRLDGPLDRERDWPLIEEAVTAFADAVAAAGTSWAQPRREDARMVPAAEAAPPGRSATG
jgi:transcriptional regulator with XRE-family HTH domain